MTKTKKRWAISLAALVLLAGLGFLSFGAIVNRALESKGIRKLLAGKTAKVLDCNAGYLSLTSRGLAVSSRGFLAQAAPSRALTEMRASRLQARCNLAQLWQLKWRIDSLWVDHLQAAYGTAAAAKVDRNEFPVPELLPPSQTESPLEIDIRVLNVSRTDLFWGSTPEAGGEIRGVRSSFFPRDKNLVVHANSGTFQQAKWPRAQIQQVKLFYAKPDLRIDEASLTLGGASLISALGDFRFEQPQTMDLQLTFTRCPIAPFLGDGKRAKLEGEFEGNAHLQKDGTQTESARASGSIAVAKAVLQNVEGLQRVATFTGRPELARMPITKIRADYDWNWPALSVKNFHFESKDLVALKGEFVVKEKKVSGEFELGVTPDLVEKFPGAKEEVFTRSEGGYLWTSLILSGTPDNLRDNLKPRLVRAAQNHFSKGLLAPIFKPGQTIIQAIEAL